MSRHSFRLNFLDRCRYILLVWIARRLVLNRHKSIGLHFEHPQIDIRPRGRRQYSFQLSCHSNRPRHEEEFEIRYLPSNTHRRKYLKLCFLVGSKKNMA